MKRIALLLVILTFSLSSQAQVHIYTETIHSGEPIYFSDWKYHPGDDPAWADPDFDDSSWESVNSLLSIDNLPKSEWSGIGWFRIRVNVNDALSDIPIAILYSQWGASDIYVNGDLFHSFGQVGTDAASEIPYLMPFNLNHYYGYASVPDAKVLNIGSVSTIIMAIRYSNYTATLNKNNRYISKQTNWQGFELGLQNYESWHQSKLKYLGWHTYSKVLFFIIPFVLSIIFFFLFLFYTNYKEYLVFSLFLLLVAVPVLMLYEAIFIRDVEILVVWEFIYFFLLLITPFPLWVALYKSLKINIPPTFWIILCLTLVQIVFYSILDFNRIYWIIVILELFRFCVSAVLQQKEGATILAFGFSFVVIATVINNLRDYSLISGSFPFISSLFWHLHMIWFISIAIYLVYHFANTTKQFEYLNLKLEDRVKQRTKELVKANEELRELDKLKSSFVSQASHDLRTPLTGIKGSMDNLVLGIAGALNEKQSKIVNRALNSITRLGNLIDDVLDLNRIETGRMVLDKSMVQMESIVKNTIIENQPFADQKQITINAAGLDQSYPLEVDGGKIERVVNELVNNAIKYTPEGGVIEVSINWKGDSPSPQPSPSGRGSASFVVFTVKDNGIGMNKEDCIKIFERFYRVDAAKMTAKGSGLGLSIAKELVEMHGGSIEVDSEVGNGTKFTMNLPVDV